MPEISVVIPVYNGEKFLDKCYDSLKNQTFDDWEAVFINDGSDDGTAVILGNMSIADKRVSVIHKDNEGVAVARECGIAAAKGDYIAFLDVDDSLPCNALEQYINNIKGTSADIVVAGFDVVNDKGQIIGKVMYPGGNLDRDIFFKGICSGKYRWQLWGKAYRRSVFEFVKTPAGMRNGEDMAVFMQLLMSAHGIRVIPDALYNYYQIGTSVTHARAKEVATDGLDAAKFVDYVLGNRIGKLQIGCIYALVSSNALRLGLSARNPALRKVLRKHVSLKVLLSLPIYKAICVSAAKYLYMNFAKWLP
ncbi:MAG: glycosyltransferase [Muribaculaceae bacterium]|nr:glycosyltransferase [Muribaculaceae bacterium]